MKAFYERFVRQISRDELKRKVTELMEIEKGQTFTAYRKAAEYVLDMIRAAGIPNGEIIEFPADGQTVYQDKKMPLAWDATVGKLTWLKGKEETVLADFQKHPFHLIKGSVATPPGGLVTKVITEQQFLAGEDPRGAMVMLQPETWPRRNVIKPILDQGGLGIISDFVMGRYKSPDSLQWGNACTDAGGWHVTKADRPFIGFAVSPRTGDTIRKAANAGGMKVRVESDGRRYEGKLPAITALIPGRQKKELWIIAHMYEPLLNDDASGVTASIEAARQIMLAGTPEYSVRLVFAMELYGYAAYTAVRGPGLKDAVIGGCNLDSLGAVTGEPLKLVPAGPAVPFIGNELLKQIPAEFEGLLRYEPHNSAYFDDIFIGDPTVGVPTVWLHGASAGYWHNSRQCDDDFIDWDMLQREVAIAAAYLCKIANYRGPAPEKPALEIKPVSSPWRDYADKMVFARLEQGFPHNLAKVPPEQRIGLPDGVIYGPFSNVLSNMDGQKTLARLILEAEAETGRTLTDKEVKKYVDCADFLADWKYLKAVSRPEITEGEILAALEKLGVKSSDVLLVHASTSKCGRIRGGAATIIDALRKAADTFMTPAFTRPYIYLGGLNKGWNYRPFDPADIESIWTGTVPKTLLRNCPDAVRSRHITHSWAGLGSHAHECLDAQGPYDPPAGAGSPMDKVLELNGKILYFGCGVAPTTFLHYLEDRTDMPFLDTAVCRVKNPDGSLKTVAIEKHLPGHRDFYRPHAEECKFFRAAVERGLEIRSVPLGMSELQLIEVRPLYEIGMELLKQDHRLLLCDDPDCLFCRRF